MRVQTKILAIRMWNHRTILQSQFRTHCSFWTLLNLPNNSLILVDILMGDTFHTKSSWKWHLTSKKMPQFLNKKYRRKHTMKVTHTPSVSAPTPPDERNQNKFPLCDNSHYYSGRNKNAELELKKKNARVQGSRTLSIKNIFKAPSLSCFKN